MQSQVHPVYTDSVFDGLETRTKSAAHRRKTALFRSAARRGHTTSLLQLLPCLRPFRQFRSPSRFLARSLLRPFSALAIPTPKAPSKKNPAKHFLALPNNSASKATSKVASRRCFTSSNVIHRVALQHVPRRISKPSASKSTVPRLLESGCHASLGARNMLNARA